MSIDGGLGRLVGSALDRADQIGLTLLPAIVASIDDTTNKLCSVYVKNDTVAVGKVRYNPDLSLAVGDPVLVLVNGSRSYFIAFKDVMIGKTAPSPPGWQLIKSVRVGSGNDITIANIPQTFTHLQVRGTMRSDRAAVSDGLSVRCNLDSGNNYDTQYLNGIGGVAAAFAFAAVNSIQASGNFPAANARAGLAGGITIDIPHYALTSYEKNLLIRADGSYNAGINETQVVDITYGHWRSTAAITALTLFWGIGNYAAGSALELYGIV